MFFSYPKFVGFERRYMEFLNYNDWQDTADTIHLLLQMAGKVKLARCEKRPEWSHVRLYLTLDGLSTGIVAGNHSPFTIHFNFRKGRIEFRNSLGHAEEILLQDGRSVSAYYKQFRAALERTGASTEINVHPQEFYDPIDFNKDEKHHAYNQRAVSMWLDNLLFAQKALYRFFAPFRGKVAFPAYYFGTMDLTGIAFSGEPENWGRKGKVMPYAFDERFYECGFWPGDPVYSQAAFFALPYPFIRDLQGHEGMLRPDKTIFKSVKQEFFLTLEDALSYPDPEKAVVEFCCSGFEIVQKLTPWHDFDWITRPLDYPQ